MANPETSLIREISRELSLLLSLITPSAHFSQVTDELVSVIATCPALENRKWHTNIFLYIDLTGLRFSTIFRYSKCLSRRPIAFSTCGEGLGPRSSMNVSPMVFPSRH